MKRFIQIAKLKPEMTGEYRRLHSAVWDDVVKMIKECNIKNYTISLDGNTAISYFEYVGDDYEKDMAKMEADPVTREWWKHTKPCFSGHDQGVYYADCDELFHLD